MTAKAELQLRNFSRQIFIEALVFIVLACAIFFPSSVNGDFGQLTLERFVFVISTLFLLFFRFFMISRFAFLMFCLILSLYLFFTLVSRYSEFAFGFAFSLMPIMILALMRVKRAPSVNSVLYLYYLVVSFIFIFAYAGFLSPAFSDFKVGFYSGGYEGLVDRFEATFTPVSIFISHSYAAFFYFLILVTSSHLIYRGFSKFVNGLIITICIVSMLALRSGSSYFFFLYSSLFLVISLFFLSHRSYISVFLKVTFLIFLIPVCVYFGIDLLPSFVDRIIGDSGNGLLSRYGDGVLVKNLEYISRNPSVGLGLSYSNDFYYTDSDYVVTALRLGIFGAVVYFLYLFLFFRDSFRRILSVVHFWFLFGGFAIFMVSMPVSTFYRSVPFLLLLILLYRSTTDSEDRSKHFGKQCSISK